MFDRLPVPTPFQVGPVNAYVAGRTVIDPGPDSEDALAALTEGVEERGLALADVERVLVTHPHPDHFGLANRLRGHGADVVASPEAAAILRDFEGRLDYEQAYFTALFEAHGMPTETAMTVTQLPEAFLEYAPSVAVDREVEAGDAVAIDGGSVAVRAAAGHSDGELVFAFGEAADGHSGSDVAASGEAGGAAAVVGDQVLGDTTPNPFLQPPERIDAETLVPDYDRPDELDDMRPNQLARYNDSLRTLREAGYDRLLPGHSAVIEDPAGRIDELLAANEERSEAVLELLDGPTSAVEVMGGLFEDLAVIDYFPGMSEALGHLDLLVERGDVVREVQDGSLLYRPA